MHTKKETKRLVLISGLIIILLFTLFSSVFKDWVTILENNKKTKELAVEYNKLLSEEEKLKSEVTKLQDPNYVARYAKERWYYSTSGDVIIRLK